jgi:hypothetical protein
MEKEKCIDSKGHEVTEGAHSCPYAMEICDDYNPEYCNCCDECESECAMEV